MDAVEALERLGGIASRHDLLQLTTSRHLRAAVDAGRIVRRRHGRYGPAHGSEAEAAADRLSGALALRSAALHHGWELKQTPPKPEIAVARGRRVVASRRTGVRVLWVPLSELERTRGVTAPLRTVVDCARLLPLDEALAIADSALRSGTVTRGQLQTATVRGTGVGKVRRVLAHASPRAANPFESVLRAACLEVGLDVRPQHPVDLGRWTCHPDLVDVGRRLVVEADSHTFHAEPVVFAADCERYNRLVLLGWTVLRFTWEQVMREPAYVAWALRSVAGMPDGDGPRLRRVA